VKRYSHFSRSIFRKTALLFFITLLVSGCGYGERVTRVIDGDTVVLADGTRIRYIGIDTPELRDRRKKIRQLAVIAKEVNEKLVLGKDLRLEYDVEKRDRYDRLLAYVYLEDGTFVNAELVKQGYALLLTIQPNVKHVDEFLRLKIEARENKRGFWADEHADFENMRKGYK